MRSITKQSGGAGRVRPGGPNRFSDALRELRPAQCIALANEVHRALAKRLDHDSCCSLLDTTIRGTPCW